MANPGALYAWVERLPEAGRYVFTRAEAARVSDVSPAGIRATLRRLEKRGAIVSPRRGFHVVVPAEYRSAGCPPATWFVDDLMRYLDRTYYVALLTAAGLHGAAHQQPMAFQVIADAPERAIEQGRVRIEFHVSNLVSRVATQTMQTEVGRIVVSTPETTALDLVRFPAASGYLSNVATVLSELTEKMGGKELRRAATKVPRSDVQRLGWLLELVGARALADALAEELHGKRLAPTPLSLAHDVSRASLDGRWHVLVNAEVEPDT